MLLLSGSPQDSSYRHIFHVLVAAVLVSYVNGNYVASDEDDVDVTRTKQGVAFDGRNQHINEPADLYNCCDLTFGSCRTACENLSLVHLATTVNSKDVRLTELRKNCPSIQTDFWNCTNQTLNAVFRSAQWSGRLCCSQAIALECQNTCATSSNARETWNKCRRSDEQTLYSCFEYQERGDECCVNARTSECLQACRDIFQNKSLVTKKQLNLIEHVCNDNSTNSKVLNCVRQLTNLTPIENSKQYLPCCGYSHSPLCRKTCTNILEIGETHQEIIDTLTQGGCGPPMPHDQLWQCFLSGNQNVIKATASDKVHVSQISQIGMDSAKLHCCYKALAPKCRRLCNEAFSDKWTEVSIEFDVDCYAQLSEIALKQCIDEVDEPCELGCDGLSFCTNFNNRPTELFRNCNAGADSAADKDLAAWHKNQSLSLPGLNLPIKNIDKCAPETWQAIACVLQIKPCSSKKHMTQICREDCYSLLTKCIDWTRMHTRHTPESICDKFSNDETSDLTGACISLKPYLEPSDLPPLSNTDLQIYSPCRGNVCNSSEVCIINRRRGSDSENGQNYYCVRGCPLGETSLYLVPLGTYARVPVLFKDKRCFKICRCAGSGRLENCQMLPCLSYEACKLSDRRIEHGSWFYVECNICSCFAGDITCTKRQCRLPGIADKSYTSLPCNCPPHHVPVCGRNGNTYPSACISKCVGIHPNEIEYRACRDSNPCQNVKCPLYSQCVENRQICLSVMHKPCRQYQCVNVTSNCKASDRPVCSIEGRTYPSLCDLVKMNATLSYMGRCLDGCRETPVCGINGISYRSECEAWSDYSLADYDGSCREIGLLTDSLGPRCASVKCSPVSHCTEGVITPPGACCPMCGGAIRIIYSRKQIDRALSSLKGKNTELLTLKAILRALEGLVHVAHCHLSGFLTIELDIFVILHTTSPESSFIHQTACIREAEKIATLIDTQSHRITSDISLSALAVANMIQPNDFDPVIGAITRNCPNSFILVASLLLLTRIETL